MKLLSASAVALSVLGFSGAAQAQQPGKLFFEGISFAATRPAHPARSACSPINFGVSRRWCGASASSTRPATILMARGSRAS